MDQVTENRVLGRRERNKLDKLQRIKAAAGDLFREKGYDGATTREIAKRAGVALGTIFTYASDKRDLLFLIYNDHLGALVHRAFSRIDEDEPLLEQIVAAFAAFYRFFAREPDFTRYLLRELTFYNSGLQAPRFQAERQSIVDNLEALVRSAKAKKALRTAEDPQAIARIIFGIYQAEVRRWLMDERPDVRRGLASLRSAMRILIKGLEPGRGAL